MQKIPRKFPAGVPAKLTSRRVLRHVETCLERIQRSRPAVREARRVRSLVEMTWESLELYTICTDLAEDAELRALVAQARGTIYTHLVGSGDDAVGDRGSRVARQQ